MIWRSLLSNPLRPEGEEVASGETAVDEADITDDTSTLRPEVQQPISELVEQFNKDVADHKFSGLSKYCVAAQQQVAVDYFLLKDDLWASFAAMLEAADKVMPGTKQAAEQQFANAGSIALDNLTEVEEGLVQGNLLVAGGARQAEVKVLLEDGSWKLEHPFVPSADDWEIAKESLQEMVDDLDEAMDAASEGEQPDMAAMQQLSIKAVVTLLDLPMPPVVGDTKSDEEPAGSGQDDAGQDEG